MKETKAIGKVVLVVIVVLTIVVGGASAFFFYSTPGESGSASSTRSTISVTSATSSLNSYSSTSSTSVYSSNSMTSGTFYTSSAYSYSSMTSSSTTSGSQSCQNSVNPQLCQFDLLNVPSCVSNSILYSVTALSFGNFSYIEPLGHVSSSAGHIFPVDHIYFYLKLNSQGVPENTTIVSPGNLTIYEIDATTFYHADYVTHDYAIYFTPCSMVTGKFDHVSGLSSRLLQSFSPPFDQCSNLVGPINGTMCRKSVDVSLRAGEKIGLAGGPSAALALDLGMKDYRTAPVQFANQSMYSESAVSPYSVCPLDYFTSDLRTSLYSYLGGPTPASWPNVIKRTVAPLCGSYDQDLPRTAQGNWFTMNATVSWWDDYAFLALIHDDINASQPVFSVGSSMSASGLQPGEYLYAPAGSGLVDRDFGDVTSNGQIYCYQSFSIWSGTESNSPFIIILQLVNPNLLRIERQSASSCGTGPWSFTSNHTDFQR